MVVVVVMVVMVVVVALGLVLLLWLLVVVEQSKKVMVENQEMKEQMKWMHEKVKKMEKEGLKPGVSSPSQSLQQAGPSGENQERGEVKNALKEYLETMHEGLARSTDVPPLRKQLEEIKNEKGKR